MVATGRFRAYVHWFISDTCVAAVESEIDLRLVITRSQRYGRRRLPVRRLVTNGPFPLAICARYGGKFGMSSASPRIWIEIDDFMRMFDWLITPTGIGRVQMEIILRLATNHPDRVSLCRVGKTADEVVIVDPARVRRLIEQNNFSSAGSSAKLAAIRARQFLRVLGRGARQTLAPLDTSAFARQVRRGDILVNFGASWEHPEYGIKIRELKSRHAIRFALLVHDVLPISHPEFVSPSHLPNFMKWFLEMGRSWDIALTPSVASAEALASALSGHGMKVPPIRPIPFGAGFNAPHPTRSAAPVHAQPYVLFVSTIEIRKNHLLLFRVWEELLRRHGAEKIPALVFIGKFGWEIDELRSRLAATRNLDGKIIVANSLGDAEVAKAYDNCLFTVFPSFCEGWGLPVTESLAHGKYCVASSATSIPEAGGRFADYFDPYDFEAALGLIERVILDKKYRASKETEIQSAFVRQSWDSCAAAVIDILTAEALQAGDASAQIREKLP